MRAHAFPATPPPRVRLALSLAMSTSLAACSALHGSHDGSAHADAVAAIEARGRAYTALVGRMDHDRIAAMFVDDGEMASAGGPTIRGRRAILDHLLSFSSYRVVSDRMSSDSVTVSGGSATQVGRYWQRVQLPDGKVIEVHGRYRTEWALDTVGTWRIRRMETLPDS